MRRPVIRSPSRVFRSRSLSPHGACSASRKDCSAAGVRPPPGNPLPPEGSSSPSAMAAWTSSRTARTTDTAAWPRSRSGFDGPPGRPRRRPLPSPPTAVGASLSAAGKLGDRLRPLRRRLVPMLQQVGQAPTVSIVQREAQAFSHPRPSAKPCRRGFCLARSCRLSTNRESNACRLGPVRHPCRTVRRQHDRSRRRDFATVYGMELAPPEGIEPPTQALGRPRSIR